MLAVRALLRAQKTGDRRVVSALVAAGLALVVGVVLARAGLVPRTAAALLALLAARAVVLLVLTRRELRARTIGVMEAALGVIFVAFLAAAWRA